MHSGMFVSAIPLESVPASLELRPSSVLTVSVVRLIADLRMGNGFFCKL